MGHYASVVSRQVTAFLPPSIGGQIDEIRSQWDPEMAQSIAAHITIVHKTTRDDHELRSSLDLVARGPQLAVRLTTAQCWGTPERGIYLGVEDIRGDIARIRQSLSANELPGVRYRPHVTLLHPRTVSASRSREAWSRLADWSVDATVMLDRIAVIELRGSRWQVVSSVSLAGE